MAPPPAPRPDYPSAPPAHAGDHPRVALRLTASRGQLALELDQSTAVGPLTVTHLAISLVGLRFPIDLSGGVSRFRHRRGALDAIEVEFGLSQLAAYLAPRLRQEGLSPAARLVLLPAHQGLVVGVHDQNQALAFHAWFAPDGETVQWVIGDARAVGFDTHAHALALRVAERLVGSLGQRFGSMLVVDRALTRLAQELLIDAGARVPETRDVHFTEWQETQTGIAVTARREQGFLVAPGHVVRAIELARLCQQADDALASGAWHQARDGYLQALEAAPRHPALTLRLAELDLLLGTPADATLGTLVEAMPAVDGGAVAARLLQAVGDADAAGVAARRDAEREPFAPLAGLMLCRSAELARDRAEKDALLDLAVARAPTVTACRWQRALERLKAGRADAAVADFGQLEAAAHGAPARFEVCLQAGRHLLDQRMMREAARFFERSLRYAPRSAEASAGLARALLALGYAEKGTSLLARAVTLAEQEQKPASSLLLELATALADVANDLPSAISHARAIAYGTVEAVAARALEGRWRAQLGDEAGASVAFGHAREAAEMLPRAAAAQSAEWLVEAAKFEFDTRRDPRTALHHAEVALRLQPQSAAIQGLFRRIGQALAPRPVASAEPAPAAHEPPPLPPAAQTEPPPAFEPSEVDASIHAPEAGDHHDEAEDEARVAELTDRLRANPADWTTAVELCELLARLGRNLDLFALVSARLEETTDEACRQQLAGYRRQCLMALSEEARAQGRSDEAEIYEQALQLDES